MHGLNRIVRMIGNYVRSSDLMLADNLPFLAMLCLLWALVRSVGSYRLLVQLRSADAPAMSDYFDYRYRAYSCLVLTLYPACVVALFVWRYPALMLSVVAKPFGSTYSTVMLIAAVGCLVMVLVSVVVIVLTERAIVASRNAGPHKA